MTEVSKLKRLIRVFTLLGGGLLGMAATDTAPAEAQFQDLGGTIAGVPECVSTGTNRIDCLARTSIGNLVHRRWNASGWNSWRNLGMKITGRISCVVPTVIAGRLECFMRGADDNQMYQRGLNMSTDAWDTTPTPLGGVLTNSPECIVRIANTINCVVRGQDRQLWHNSYTPSTGWSGWGALGGDVAAEEISCSGIGADRMDCFVRGSDNALWHIGWYTNAWAWDGGPIVANTSGRPECVRANGTRIDCFVRNPQNQVLHTAWTGSAWSAPFNFNGNSGITKNVSCSTWVPSVNGGFRIDCILRDSQKSLVHHFWDNGWQSAVIGGQTEEEPLLTAGSSGHIDLFVRGTSNGLFGIYRSGGVGLWNSNPSWSHSN